MTVTSILIGVGVIAAVTVATIILIRDHINGNHCSSCRGCAKGCRGVKYSCDLCVVEDEKKEE
jgi:hypothetical protein